MFFSIGRSADRRFPFHSRTEPGWWISRDDGWEHDEIKGQIGKGIGNNRLVIDVGTNDITFDHGPHRSFPLWWNQDTQTLTNLMGTGELIRADKKYMLFNQWLVLGNRDIHGPIDDSQLSWDAVADDITKRLRSEFFSADDRLPFDGSDQLPISPHLPKSLGRVRPVLYVSGGLDTVTLLALLHDTWPLRTYSIQPEQHFDMDDFTDTNISGIRRDHWAYNQIHHWRSRTVLLSGAYGDEYLMRGPYTVALWAAWHDINLEHILNNSHGYHVPYYLKPMNLATIRGAWQRRAEIREQYVTYCDLIRQILDINANDHQHWHLGNTRTWTPFLDSHLTKTILRLSPDDLLRQIINGDINREVIRRTWPAAEVLVSRAKNLHANENLYLLSSLR